VTLCHAHKIALDPSIQGLEPASVVVLAVKPQMLESVSGLLHRLVHEETVVLSILAGKTRERLQQVSQNTHSVVRAMPNLAASVRQSATVAIASAAVTAHQKHLCTTLLRSVGTLDWIEDESLLDAVTAVAGSGPAYVFYLVECLEHAGVRAGLPAPLAARLARQTVLGAGNLLAETDQPVGKLRHAVTSPQGTTAAALDVLSKDACFQDILEQAVFAAQARGHALADEDKLASHDHHH
jgi:pyrroline-5-carboxylate reductase